MVSTSIFPLCALYISQLSNEGEYQPNMGLKSAMERLEGANAQLREQVRLCRQEEERSSAASQRLRSRLAAAEAELKAIKGGFMGQPPTQVDKAPCLSIKRVF